MEVTEVRVRLVNDRNERLKAFCCMTIDGEFVVRDIKVIEGTQGLFVAMPSRKITDHCPKCGGKNPLRAKYCNDCGGPLKGGKFDSPPDSSDKLHADIAHPINSHCRGRIQEAILEAYNREFTASGGATEAPDQAAPPPTGGGEAPQTPAEGPTFADGIL